MNLLSIGAAYGVIVAIFDWDGGGTCPASTTPCIGLQNREPHQAAPLSYSWISPPRTSRRRTPIPSARWAPNPRSGG